MSAVVSYVLFEDLVQAYPQTLGDLAKEVGATAVAELGAGAKPLLADDERWSFVPHRVLYDIDAGELEKAGTRLEKRVADLCQPLDGNDDAGRYDLVFSKMLCEHLTDPEVFHRNCLRLLRPGGVSVHFFPTLYASPFVLNRVIPESSARKVLDVLQPGRLQDPARRKFPAFYRWCYGPTRRSMRRFEALGFEIQEWKAAFGHSYYRRFPPLQAVEDAKSRLLARHPVRRLSSFSLLVLRKPQPEAAATDRT